MEGAHRRSAGNCQDAPSRPPVGVSRLTRPDTVSQLAFGDREFRFIAKLVAEHAGISLKDSKKGLVYGRLSKRVRSLGMVSFKEYCALLEGGDSEEFTFLINAITTNVTSFFRERHHFDLLRLKVFPWVIQKNANERFKKLRIWSAGCSTGEEPYSIAISVLEHRPSFVDWDVEILATDLDSNVVAKAKSGVYRADHLEHSEMSGRKHWFQKGRGANQGIVRTSQSIRDMINFSVLNLVEPWKQPGKFDLIFCRNVMIYFAKETRDQLLAKYHSCLAPGGYLFVGHSESLIGSSDLFESAGITVYRKRS